MDISRRAHASASNRRAAAAAAAAQEAAGGRPAKRSNKDPFVELRDRWHRTALHWAVVNAEAGAVRALVAAGAAVNAVHMPVGKHLKSTSLPLEAPLPFFEAADGSGALMLELPDCSLDAPHRRASCALPHAALRECAAQLRAHSPSTSPDREVTPPPLAPPSLPEPSRCSLSG